MHPPAAALGRSLLGIGLCLIASTTLGAGRRVHRVKPDPPPEQRGELVDAQLVEATTLIRAAEARSAYNVTGAGLTVAVVDTGIRAAHQDFAGRVVAQRNFTANNGGSPTDASDGEGHGSHVSGIVAANGVHVGIAPGASIAAVKVLDNTGNGTFADVLAALDWVIANRAGLAISVVNLSLGDGGNYSAFAADEIQDRIATLRALNVPVCAAAGNDFFGWDSTQGMGYPAVFGSTVSVGAVYDATVGRVSYGDGSVAQTTAADRLCPFGQRLHPTRSAANRTDVFAPGAPITSTGITSNTASATGHGTSQATPMVAGVILLLQQYYLRETGALPTVTQLETWIRNGAATINDGDDEDDNVNNTGLDFLRVDAVGALAALDADLDTYRVSGTVTLNGSGLAGVTLSAGGRSAVTDANGAYTVTGLVAGSYTVTPSLPAYAFTPQGRVVTVPADQTGIDFQATPADFTISGTVTLNGTGAGGTTVSAGGKATVTGDNGGYVITGLTAGTYAVTAARSGYSFSPAQHTVTLGPNKSGVDFAGTPVGGSTYSISGTILAGGGGLSGVTVTAGSRSGTTNAAGAYVISGLTGGSYGVTPSLAGFTFDPSARSVAVGPSATGVDFTATGTDTFSVGGSVTVDGIPLPGVTITDGDHTAVTEADGTFSIRGLPAGRYTFAATRPGYVFSPTTRTVSVGPDRVGVTFAATRLLSISGTVLLDGAGLSGVMVRAGPASAVTGSHGEYTLSDLAPANYSVTPSLTGYVFDPTTRTVALAADDAVSVDFDATAVPVLASLSLAAPTIKAGKFLKATVTFTRPVTARRSVTLRATPTGLLGMPASVTVKKGASRATFKIKAARGGAVVNVLVSASSEGITRTAGLRVEP